MKFGRAPKPKAVQDARIRGDHSALVEMGSNGGKQAAENRADEKRRQKERLEKEFLERSIQANEHIVTPDGEEGLIPDGIIPPDLL